MQLEEQLDPGAIERLGKQSGFLLRMYQADLARDPTGYGAESSRSNMIALRHTIEQIYGEATSCGTFKVGLPVVPAGEVTKLFPFPHAV
jgi:hypothetical protein